MRSVTNIVDNLIHKIREVLYLSDKYPTPKHGWTCFHCGETFYRKFLARHHFGKSTTTPARCQQEMALLRKEVSALEAFLRDEGFMSWTALDTEQLIADQDTSNA